MRILSTELLGLFRWVLIGIGDSEQLFSSEYIGD